MSKCVTGQKITICNQAVGRAQTSGVCDAQPTVYESMDCTEWGHTNQVMI